MEQKIYKVNLYGGYIGLIAAIDLDSARKKAMSEQGSANVTNVSLATPEDIDWVKAMGGLVPKIRNKLPSEWAKEGYYITKRKPKVGDFCDYYDREGNKRVGTITAFDGQNIKIDGERTIIVKDTFKVIYER